MNRSDIPLRVNTSSDFGKLRSTILGTFDNKNLPLVSFSPNANFDEATEILRPAYPDWYVDEVNEDINSFAKVLLSYNVDILRPSWPFPHSHFKNPLWSSQGFDIYNVRDNHLVIGNTIISTPPSERFRVNEHYAFQDIFQSLSSDSSIRWIYAPRPKLPDGFSLPLNSEPTELQLLEDQKHINLSSGHHEHYSFLIENEPVFDAANVCRLGHDLLYLVSSTANKQGFNWLSNVLGTEYNVIPTMTYRSSHIDSTICPLRQGLVLLNADRIDERTIPAIFNDWDKIYFSDVSPIPGYELDFYNNIRLPIFNNLKSLGFFSRVGAISSPWGGLNVFSISDKVVVVESSQYSLIKELERYGLTVIPVRYRHFYTMLGCLHCSTLDLVRDEPL